MTPKNPQKPRREPHQDTLFETRKLLQPYCKRAGTGAYAVDKLLQQIS